MSAGDFEVFAYESILHTRSPLLRWLYCESHALEPFAAWGSSARSGEYRFPNVLWVDRASREAMLDRVFLDVMTTPGWARDVELRFKSEAKRVLKYLSQSRRSVNASLVEGLLAATARYLSVGVFKEALTDEGIEVLLGQFVPATKIRPYIPQLWQPRCLPHFLKFELRALFAAERLSHNAPNALSIGIERTAHHSRFLVEDTPFHNEDTFQKHLHELISSTSDPRGIRSVRLARIREHLQARRRADAAQESLLAEVSRFGRHTLQTKLKIHALLRFIRFIGTAEELKHILTVETARVCRLVMDQLGLEVDSTGPDELVAALRAHSALVYFRGLRPDRRGPTQQTRHRSSGRR